MIRQVFEASLAALKRLGVPLVVLDVPLLLEAGYQCYCDQVVVVKVDPLTQLHRLMARNHYGSQEARERIATQMPLAEKLAHADVVIDNNGSREKTARQVTKLIASWRKGPICTLWYNIVYETICQEIRRNFDALSTLSS